EHQTHAVRGAMRADGQPRQHIQSIQLEGLQVLRTAQDSQDVEVAQRGDAQDGGLDQSPTQGHQGEAPVDGLQNHVERGDERDVEREGDEIAGDAETKETLVGDEVQRCLRGITRDDQLAANIELRKDGRGKRTQVGESHHPRGFALRFVRRRVESRRSSRGGAATPLMTSHSPRTRVKPMAGTHWYPVSCPVTKRATWTGTPPTSSTDARP